MKKLEKMKPMLPSLREKKRYLVFEILPENKEVKITSFFDVNRAVWDACLAFLGELGTSKAGIMLLKDKWDAKKQRGIVRVDRKYVDHVKTSLALVKKVNGEKALIRCIGVSGVLGKSEKKYILSH